MYITSMLVPIYRGQRTSDPLVLDVVTGSGEPPDTNTYVM